MKLYFAGPQSNMLPDKRGVMDAAIASDTPPLYLLESFWSIREKFVPSLLSVDGFLLDSGAFTMFNSGRKVNLDEYVGRYIDFINKWDIKYFFELDIDVIVGLDKVERIRDKIESETGKKSIPVWHRERGKSYWLSMADAYDYISIGGIVSKEIASSEYDIFHYLINEAEKRGAKVHGLGFTSVPRLNKYNFYSVDSTSWLSGSRFGTLYVFDGRTLKSVNPSFTKYKRKNHYNEIDAHNILQWTRYQYFLDKRR